MSNFSEKLLIVLGAILIVIIGCFIVAWPFMLLWNWLMPTIFGLSTINFWQSVGLLVLCSFLFKDVNTNSK